MNAEPTPNPIDFTLATVADEVRHMPVAEARLYLRGLLVLIGDNIDAEPLREIYAQIDGADAQLELIASGQLRLNLAA